MEIKEIIIPIREGGHGRKRKFSFSAQCIPRHRRKIQNQPSSYNGAKKEYNNTNGMGHRMFLNI